MPARLDACARCGIVYETHDDAVAAFLGLPRVARWALSLCARCAWTPPATMRDPTPRRRHR